MDRCEDVSRTPTGKVYVACTNNRTGAPLANP